MTDFDTTIQRRTAAGGRGLPPDRIGVSAGSAATVALNAEDIIRTAVGVSIDTPGQRVRTVRDASAATSGRGHRRHPDRGARATTPGGMLPNAHVLCPWWLAIGVVDRGCRVRRIGLRRRAARCAGCPTGPAAGVTPSATTTFFPWWGTSIRDAAWIAGDPHGSASRRRDPAVTTAYRHAGQCGRWAA